MENQVILKFFADYIQSELGIIYVEANYFQLEHSLKDIANQLGYEDILALYQEARLGISGQMKSLLLDLATNKAIALFMFYSGTFNPCHAGHLGKLKIRTLFSDNLLFFISYILY
jgi:hypothetical protein